MPPPDPIAFASQNRTPLAVDEAQPQRKISGELRIGNNAPRSKLAPIFGPGTKLDDVTETREPDRIARGTLLDSQHNSPVPGTPKRMRSSSRIGSRCSSRAISPTVSGVSPSPAKKTRLEDFTVEINREITRVASMDKDLKPFPEIDVEDAQQVENMYRVLGLEPRPVRPPGAPGRVGRPHVKAVMNWEKTVRKMGFRPPRWHGGEVKTYLQHFAPGSSKIKPLTPIELEKLNS